MQYFWQKKTFLFAVVLCASKGIWCDENHLAFERKELLKVAYSLEKSLNDLRALEKAKAIQSGLAEVQLRKAPTGGAMDQIVTLQNWEGPLEELLKAIAKKYHYKFTTIGQKTLPAIFVSIGTQGKTLGTIIQDADLQAGTRAYISVDHNAEPTIELRYV